MSRSTEPVSVWPYSFLVTSRSSEPHFSLWWKCERPEKSLGRFQRKRRVLETQPQGVMVQGGWVLGTDLDP